MVTDSDNQYWSITENILYKLNRELQQSVDIGNQMAPFALQFEA